MAKFEKTFHGVPEGEIYPVEYKPGDECPKELESSAQALGVLEAVADPQGSKKPAKAKGEG